jgi:yersiniabactin nonribosomal peptide synthetase
MVPAVFVTLDRLPHTSSGKLDRGALARRPAAELTAALETGAEERTEPRDEVEEQVRAVWSQVLRVEGFGVHQSFFDLGGDSLLATRILVRLRQLFRVEVTLGTFLEDATVAGLSAALVAAEEKPGQVLKIARVRQRIERMSPEEKRRMLEARRTGAVPA